MDRQPARIGWVSGANPTQSASVARIGWGGLANPDNLCAMRWIDYWESSHGTGDMSRDFFEVMLRPLPTPKEYSESLSWGLSSKLTSASRERFL